MKTARKYDLHGKQYTPEQFAKKFGISVKWARELIVRHDGNLQEILYGHFKLKKSDVLSSAGKIRKVRCPKGWKRTPGNTYTRMPLRERSWIGCTFSTRLRGQGQKSLTWRVDKVEDGMAIVTCINGPDYMIGKSEVMSLDAEVYTTKWLPDPDYIKAECERIRRGWSPEEKKRAMEGSREGGSEVFRCGKDAAKRRQLEADARRCHSRLAVCRVQVRSEGSTVEAVPGDGETGASGEQGSCSGAEGGR